MDVRRFLVWCPVCGVGKTFDVRPVPVESEMIGGRMRWSGRVEWPTPFFLDCRCGAIMQVGFEWRDSGRWVDAVVVGVDIRRD